MPHEENLHLSTPNVVPKTFRGKIETTRRRKEEENRKELLEQEHEQ